jgi:hypothetical protein
MGKGDGRPALRGLAALAAGLVLGLALGSCGAVGTPAPDLAPGARPLPTSCRPLREKMPGFFTLLDRDDSPLRGLAEVVGRLADGGDVRGNVVGNVVDSLLRGVIEFSRDPDESREAECLPKPPERPLCTVEAGPGDDCESRLCAVRRLLDFGIRDERAAAALAQLEPVLVTVLGYLSNQGPGADGKEHLEAVEVLHRASSAEYEAVCAPRNLTVVLDGLVVYLRPNAACGENCPGKRLLRIVKEVVEDPALEGFLGTYEAAEADGSGRVAFQKLGRVLLENVAGTPEDERYFDSVRILLDQVGGFLARDPKYAGLKGRLDELASLLKDLLNPSRPGALLRELKVVVRCIIAVDPGSDLVGAIYDLLRKPGGTAAGGLDLKDMITAFEGLADADADGVLLGAIHALLASLAADEAKLETVRALLEEALTAENARLAAPALQALIEAGVIDELFGVLNDLLYGCKAVP